MATALDTEIRPGKLYINGEWQDAASGRSFETINPTTGEPLTEVAEAGEEDIDRAVRAARQAFEDSEWTKMDARKRGRILMRIAEGIEARVEELARVETLDNGKPLKEARAFDIPDSADCFRYYGGWADKIEGEVIPVPGPFLNYTRREPVGVCAQIIPWNYPLQMAAWKVAPALACGNTVVLKPAEQTPLTALELARIAEEAGLPPGVLNVVPGYGETAGAALVRHPEVDKIAFTGSTEVGKII
ncbi:MAG TPA: aldehyde dehydrogenase family protein, partial [Longimicrobiaceae bacterium]|nr:aldehyde dehydrogenase family protein [Longimicrobiaceae bacterium]